MPSFVVRRPAALARSSRAVIGLASVALALAVGASCASSPRGDEAAPEAAPSSEPAPARQLATFAGGCFWCVEAVFERIAGVEKVESGYTGGALENPTYKQICDTDTGHAEAIQLTFDPSVVSFADLVEVFFVTHDPTTKDRQGNDWGTQYRSAIFYHDEEQQRAATAVKDRLGREGAYADPIVTEIVPAARFWPAEDYHQDYFEKFPSQPYCNAVIPPKLEKLEKHFKDKMK